MIIFNHYSGSANWFVKAIDVKTRVNWFIKRVKFRFSEILKTWSIASLISTCDAELADDRNQMDVKIDLHQAGFFSKHPVFHFAPMFHFAPTYYIYVYIYMRR